MNVGITGGALASAAGAPLSQTANSETERTQKESGARDRQVDAQEKSERAAGIGQTQEDSQTSERDADGRRLWEGPANKKSADGEPQADPERQSKDPSGITGSTLDLTG